ncbi:hypothetical protein BSPWISOXPB_4733 [uncultured Gammaproteobacteria bacterium]|nr:hypothetical protein BSPWISOXPB_4733 [uncultured Gammaproteobacteria bacterium]
MAPAGQVHMRRQALVAKPTHGHKEHKMLSLLCVGGIAAELGGGKFANGGMSAV